MNSSLSLANLALAAADELEVWAMRALEIRTQATMYRSCMVPRFYGTLASNDSTDCRSGGARPADMSVWLSVTVMESPRLFLLIDQFQRELNLARVAGGLADFAKTVRRADAGRRGGSAGVGGDAKNVGRQAQVDDVEEVEKLGAKLQARALRSALPATEGCVFDESEVVVVESGSPKGVTSQGTEATLVRTGTAGH